MKLPGIFQMYRLDIRFKWWAFLFSTGMLILLGSCRSDTAYHVYQSVAASGWGRQDTLVYEIPASLSPGRYFVEIGLRNTSEYAYRDIWLTLLSGQGVIPEDAVSSGRGSNLQADSCAFRADTLHLYLADQYGRWLHDGISGSLYQSEWPAVAVCLVDSVSDKPRTLRLVHLMKDTALRGISDVGLRFSIAPVRHQSGERQTAGS